ncbi:uncharacterized protein LOC144822047 isoform X2 [Lissotriton helveticus]
MPPQCPQKDAGTFQDVATCFSDQEWTLLHEWQKGLYDNVMKEIHQALISLGPLISSYIFSLKQKEKDIQVFKDHPDTEYSEGSVFSMQAASCHVKEEGYHIYVDQQGSERDKAIIAPIGDVICAQTASCKIKEEPLSFHVHSQGSEPEQNISASVGQGVIVPVMSRIIKPEEEVFLGDLHRYEVKGVPCNPSGETVVAPTPPQMNIHEEEAHFQEEQRSDASNTYPVVTGVYSLGCDSEVGIRVKEEPEPEFRIPGDGDLNRRRNRRDSLRGSGRTTPSKEFTMDLSTISAMKPLPTSKKKANSQRLMWSECYRELGREQTTQRDSEFGNPVPFSCAQEGVVVGRSYEYNEIENILRNSHVPKEPPNVHSSQRTNTGTDSDKSHSLKAKITTNMKVMSRERPFACADCGKRFFKKSHLITHRRRQYGEKAHGCIFCHKRFNQKVDLDSHIKIHTGARPYTCTECEESFVRRRDLNQHRKRHTQTSKTTK